MNQLKHIILLLLFSTILLTTGCSNKKTKQNPTLATIDLQRGDITLCYGEQFGDVNVSFWG